jgi:outer membrane protein assembly factor BamD
MLRNRFVMMLLLIFVVSVVGCTNRASRAARPALAPEFLNLSKEELFAKAEEEMERKRYSRARTFYSHVYENYPNDPLGRRSLLKIADTYFNQGDQLNLIESQYKYRDFLNRYPGSDSADYAMLQIANVSFRQISRPERDQTKTREAIQKLQEMIAAFPNSSYRPEAEEKLKIALDRLARHEHRVAQFYIQRRNWDAAVARLNTIVDQYPDYTARDEMFFDFGRALESAGRKGEARLYYERVVAEFSGNPIASRAKERLESLE